MALAASLAGAVAIALTLPQQPDYVADLPTPVSVGHLGTVWLRPRFQVHASPPVLCVLVKSNQALRLWDLPYSASSTGSLRLSLAEQQARAEQLVLVLGPRLPACKGLALLGLWGGSSGPLFRGFMKLTAAQVLTLPATSPAPSHR